jgi:hypothetical protein
MGTSRANRLPKTKTFKKIIGSLKSPFRSPSTITTLTLSAAFDYIPLNYTTSPLLISATEGSKFIDLVEKSGLKETLEKIDIPIDDTLLVSKISHILWNDVAAHLSREHVWSPYGQLTEKAFKKTLSMILNKGNKALEDL